MAVNAAAPSRRSETTLYGASFLVSLAAGLVGLDIIFYAQDVLRLSPRHVGLLASMWSVAYIVGCVWLRPALYRFSLRARAMGAALFVGVSVFGLVLYPGVAWAFAWYASYGLAMSQFWPSVMGWLSTSREGKELNRVMSFFNLAWSGANILSPFLAGWIAEYSTRAPLFVASALLLLAWGWVIAGTRRGTGLASPPPAAGEIGEVPQAERGTLLRFPAWVGLVACYVSVGVLLTTFPMAARRLLRMRESVVGGLLLVHALTNAGTFVILGVTSRWHFRLAPIVLPLLFRAVLFLALVRFSSTAGIAAILFALGATWSLSYTASLFHGVSGSRDRARRMAIHETLIASAVLVGNIAGPIIYETWSLEAAYAACAAVAIIGAAAQGAIGLVLRRRWGGGWRTEG